MTLKCLILVLGLLAAGGCAQKPDTFSQEPFVAEIKPELVRTREGGVSLRASTNLPDGTQLRAFSTELAELRECSVARNLCEFSAWEATSLIQNYEMLNVTIQADFGFEQQPEPVYKVVGVLGSNLRGPLVVSTSVESEPFNLVLKTRLPVSGS